MTRAKNRARAVKWLIGGLASLLLLWAVLSVSGARAVPPSSAAAAALGGPGPDQLIRDARREVLDRRGRLSDATFERMLGVMDVEPLAADPFIFAGLRALERNDVQNAASLLIEGRRRDPRSRLGRLLLIGLRLQQGRISEASTEIATFVRLVPAAGSVLVPELARHALNPRSRQAVVAAIGGDPLMEPVLDHLAANGADPDLVLSLAARQPAGPAGQLRLWQARLVQRMVEEGRVARARDLWRRFAGITSATDGLVYDAQFRGLPGPPPFNWELAAGDIGSAELEAGRALDVTYVGNRTGSMARQLVLLPPGAYRFDIQVEGSANGQGSRLAWQLVCVGGSSPLLDLPVRDLSASSRLLSGQFTVPAQGCPAQWLQLLGIAAEFPTTQAARFSELSVRQAGRN